MPAFNPTALKPASQIAEFATASSAGRTAKAVVLEGIARQTELFRDPKAEGRRWFTSGATHTAFTIRLANKPLKLQGDETKLAVETKDFEAALAYFARQIEAGRFDDQLGEATKAMDARKAKMKATRASKKADQTAVRPAA